MKKIIEAGNLPYNEIVYLRKDFMGWRVIDPIKDPITNKFIWKNFLNKKGFVTLGFLLLILLFSYLGFQEQLNNYQTVMENPCNFCEDCNDILSKEYNEYNFGGDIKLDYKNNLTNKYG